MEFPNARFRVGSSKRHILARMKEWVNFPWVLQFHLAQAEQPVRLLSDPSVSEAVVGAAEQKVKRSWMSFLHTLSVGGTFDGKTIVIYLPRLCCRRRLIGEIWPCYLGM
jgi:hypothetical protein